MRVIEITRSGEKTVGEINEDTNGVTLIQSMDQIERSMQRAVDRLRSIKDKKKNVNT